MENIIVDTTHGYQELKPVEGYVITKYVEGVDDIKDYYSTTEVDAPLDADVSIYRAVTLEQDKVYKEQQAVAIEEAEKARKAKEENR